MLEHSSLFGWRWPFCNYGNYIVNSLGSFGIHWKSTRLSLMKGSHGRWSHREVRLYILHPDLWLWNVQLWISTKTNETAFFSLLESLWHFCFNTAFSSPYSRWIKSKAKTMFMKTRTASTFSHRRFYHNRSAVSVRMSVEAGGDRFSI